MSNCSTEIRSAGLPERPEATSHENFPQTRYLGSKRKLLPVLSDVFSNLEFGSALDAFAGTGSVAYLLKTMGKAVTAVDVLNSNVMGIRALVENDSVTLGPMADALTEGLPDRGAPRGFVERTFDGLFFEPEENRFIDGILPRLRALKGFQKDLAFFALAQACLAKRPYNLFHRANLYMRHRDVKRTFGNKTTWDRPFQELFQRYSSEADRAVFSSGQPCVAYKSDVLEVNPDAFDLVYFDPPYVSKRGQGVDYFDYYHFLEGLAAPEEWEDSILHKYKHKPLKGRGESPWCSPKHIDSVFEKTIARFNSSVLVVSYRSDGIPSIKRIADLIKARVGAVTIVDAGKYTYALSRNRSSREVVLVGTPRTRRRPKTRFTE